MALDEAEKNIKSQTNEMKLELKIRKKALENKSFPSEEVIEEFLKVPKYLESEVSAKWLLPDINAFIVGLFLIINTNIMANYFNNYYSC